MPAAAGAAIATWVGAGVGATLAIKAVVYVVYTLALSKISQMLAGKPKDSALGAGRDVTVKGSIEPRQLVYGEIETPGFIAFYTTSSLDISNPNRYLWFVIVVAGHQCESMLDSRLDDRLIPSADINGSTGEVTTAAFVNGTSKLSIWTHLGELGQLADANLEPVSQIWTSSHRGSGIAYRAYRLDRDEKVWPSGAPGSFFNIVRGRRLYDPRLDSTNGGSGLQRTNNATTWTWSRNWALAVRDYISGGSIYYNIAAPDKRLTVGEADARMNDAYTIAAANKSDEDVTIPPASPTTTQDRYTCDVQLSCGETHGENLDILNSAGIGHVAYVDGQYRIYAGAYDSPTITLNEADILGPVEILTHPPGEENYNAVGGTFFDDSRNWQQSTFPIRVNPNYELDDRGQRVRNIKLWGTRSGFRAQRIAEVHLKQSRHKTTVHFTQLSPNAMDIAEWETFNSNISEFGWVNKVLRCIEHEDLPNGFIAMTAREELAAAYADPAVADYAEPGAAVSPAPDIELPQAPSNFIAQGTRNGIQFSWTLPSTGFLTSVVELWEHTANTPFSSATMIWDGVAAGKFIGKTDLTQRYYWIRLRTVDKRLSTTVPAGNGLPGKATVVETALSAVASPTSVSASDDDANGSATTPSTTVTPSGGTAPYTYAWTWAVGGTDITINSTTSAMTSFTGTGLTGGETLTGTARCTVTDNVSATYTVDVEVSISRPAPTVTAPSVSLTSVKQSPTDASAAFQIDADGHWYSSTTTSAPTTDQGSWATPNVEAGNYESRVTRTGGSESAFTTGSNNTWEALTSDRLWRLTNSDNSDSDRDIIFTIEIRRASDMVVVSTTTGNTLVANVFTTN